MQHCRIACVLLVVLFAIQPDTFANPSARPSIRVLFSPGGGCTDAIVGAIDNARSSIEVQAYSFTSAPIAEAVAKAHARGVKVRVVLDKSQRTERYTSATYLFNHKVPVWIDAKHAIAHNKVILIDRNVILTGSFNFTKSAESRNAENLLIIQGHSELASQYLSNFEEHLSHAQPYDGLASKGGDSVSEDDQQSPAARKPVAKRARKAA